MNEIDELIGKFRVEQSKYSYYIIALCVAAIGFSITQTMGRALEPSLWPLAGAVFLFGLSVFSGLKFINLVIGGISTDIIIKQMQAGNNELLIREAILRNLHPDNPDIKRIGIEATMQNSKKKTRKGVLWYKTQLYSFYLGIACFIGWRVYEMYLLSLTTTS